MSTEIDLSDLDKHPGYKRVNVTLVLRVSERVPVEWSDEAIQFYIEENHCIDNYIDAIHKAGEKSPYTCQTCHRGEAWVGHHKFQPSEVSRVDD